MGDPDGMGGVLAQACRGGTYRNNGSTGTFPYMRVHELNKEIAMALGLKRFYTAGVMALAVAGAMALAEDAAAPSHVPADYKGTPFTDEKMKEAQKIPGKVFLAYFDNGGEGVAFHDSDKVNLGNGVLNKGDKTYVGMFRREEGVDISYTKKFWDNWEGEKVTPDLDQLYVGWTDPGEWWNVTVDVTEAGTYTVDLMYTSNKGGAVSLDVNKTTVADKVKIETTNDPADKEAGRQWHHWNLAKGIADVKLEKGKNLLTFKMEENGNMNLLYLDFKAKK
jgi:hypothetical protein